MESAIIIGDPKSKGYGFVQGIFDYICRKEGRGFLVNLGRMDRTEFKDGEYKLKISHNIREKKVFFIHDSNKEPTKWLTDLIFVLDAMRYSSPSEINVVLPYTRFARQDRKDESRVSVNIKAVADIVSFYAHRGLTIDLHAPQIQEFFGIPFDNLFSHPVVIDHLREKHPEFLNNLVVVSPDAGGGGRVGAFQKKLARDGINSDMAICYKRRARENVVEEIKIMGDVAGKNCLILDDLIDTGGTLVKCAQSLKAAGAVRVFAYGTHGLFSDGGDKFGEIDKLLVSDTLCCDIVGNFERVSMVDLFGEAIYRTIVGESLSGLFE